MISINLYSYIKPIFPLILFIAVKRKSLTTLITIHLILIYGKRQIRHAHIHIRTNLHTLYILPSITYTFTASILVRAF